MCAIKVEHQKLNSKDENRLEPRGGSKTDFWSPKIRKLVKL